MMKRKISRLLTLALSGAFVFSVQTSDACTNFLVTKGASTDGSTFVTYAADSHYLYGELYFRPAMDYPAGTLQKIYEWDTGKFLGEIPQVAHTYKVIGNMNEHQLTIGETTYGGRGELVDTTGIIDYGSLIYTTLQRAKNAREAIKVFHELVSTYGYYSSGESFSIADPNEVWILELIGKGTKMQVDKKTKQPYNANKGAVWVAIRIPDGYVSAHANQARITTFPLANGKTSITSKDMKKVFNPEVEVVYAHDVISFAREMKYFEGKDADFSFSDTYAPVDFGAARFSEARVWSFFKNINKDMWAYQDYAKGHNLSHRMPLYIKPDRKLNAKDLMQNMRDHYEGTDLDMTTDMGAGPHALPYRWRPLTWKYEGKTYFNERAIGTQQTGFSFVAQMRSWLPNAIGGVYWFAVDDASTCVYTPLYAGLEKCPETFAENNGDMLNYSSTSAFWAFNKVSNFAYLRYDVMSKDIIKVQQELEDMFIANVATVDAKANELLAVSPEKANEYLTEYSVSNANAVTERWNRLFEYLLVKYMDGNIKQEKNGKFIYNEHNNGTPASVSNPQYPDWWKKMLIEQTGDKLEYRGGESH